MQLASRKIVPTPFCAQTQTGLDDSWRFRFPRILEVDLDSLEDNGLHVPHVPARLAPRRILQGNAALLLLEWSAQIRTQH